MSDHFREATTEHKHKTERGIRSCPMHNKDGHWMDDEAYVDDERLPVPEEAPNWETLVDAIKANKPEGNAIVYRFALVFVDAENGALQVLTNPGAGPNQSINMLARAAASIAFQQAAMEEMARSALLEQIMGGSFPTPDDVTEGEIPSGQYP